MTCTAPSSGGSSGGSNTSSGGGHSGGGALGLAELAALMLAFALRRRYKNNN
jgi:hypothetical protein